VSFQIGAVEGKNQMVVGMSNLQLKAIPSLRQYFATGPLVNVSTSGIPMCEIERCHARLLVEVRIATPYKY
jgi:hypothetical protein